jgi:hypothetical protein
MPRLKPPPAKPEQELEIEDRTPPVGEVEIELSADPSGETEVDLHPSPTVQAELKPEPKPEPVVEDNPLQKALDQVARAEEIQRTALRERDEIRRQASEREEELTRDRDDAQYNSVLTAIAAEQSTLDKAEGDYAAFASAGDWTSAAKAQRIIASASARLDRLEDGKQAFESKRETGKTAPPERKPAPQDATLDFEQRIATLPTTAKDWLRKHPEFINDTAQNRKIQAAHGSIVELDGVEPFSAAYFDALDTRFGFKAAPQPEPKPAPQPQRRSMPMSAPVSRDVPTPSGQRQENSSKVTLSAEERQIARNAIVDRPDMPKMSNEQKELIYARNKQKLHRMRANGEYRATTEQTG